MLMTNKTYDILKYIALLILPIAAFVAKVGEIWGLGWCEGVSATLIALDAVLGAVVKISSDAYKDQANDQQ